MKTYIVSWEVAYGRNPERRETHVRSMHTETMVLTELVSRERWDEGVRPHMVRILGHRECNS